MNAHWFSATSPASVSGSVVGIAVLARRSSTTARPTRATKSPIVASGPNREPGRRQLLRRAAGSRSSRRARRGTGCRSAARAGSAVQRRARRRRRSGRRQPRPQSALDVLDLRERHPLLVVVRELRVAGAVVDGGHAERARSARRRSSRTSAAARRPPPRRTPARAGRRAPGRAPTAMSTTSTSKPAKTSRTCRSASSRRPARREAVVDLDLAQVGDDVARHPAADPHGVEPLAVDESVDGDIARAGTRRGGRARAPPCGSRSRRPTRARCARGRRGCARSRGGCRCSRPRPAPLEGSPRIAKSRGEEVGARAREPGESVEVGVDLLVVVPHPGDVDAGIGELGGELQLHRDAGLHVDGAATPEVRLAVDLDVARRHVAVDRHGVDVTGDHHALRRGRGRCGRRSCRRRGRPPGAASGRIAASIASARTASSPETLGMSQIVRVRSTEVAVRSSGGIPRV